MEYDPDSSMLLRDGEPYLNLLNIFWEFSTAPVWQRPDVLQKCVRVWFTPARPLPQLFEDARPDVLPRIYARSHYENQLFHDNNQRIHTIFGDHFAVGLVYDHRDTIEPLSADQLAQWKVSKEEAFSVALQNLREMSLPPQFSAYMNGVFVASYQDDYDSARFLLSEIIGSLNVVGDVVALMPNRRTLIIGGVDDSTGLCTMADLALESREQPWPISGIAMWFHDGRWQPYQPPSGHPASSRFRDLWLRSMNQAYAQQSDTLGSATERDGIVAYVAEYVEAMELNDHNAYSLTVWPNGLPSLLPRVDVLCIVVDPPTLDIIETGRFSVVTQCENLFINWDDAYSVMGDMMAHTDGLPGAIPDQGHVRRGEAQHSAIDESFRRADAVSQRTSATS